MTTSVLTRGGVELRLCSREPEAVLGTFGPPVLLLAMLGTIYCRPALGLPPVYQSLGAFFPRTWLGQAFRSVLLPDEMAVYELAEAWEHGRTALVLAAWCIGGLVLCLKTFRWRSPRDG